MFTLAKHRSGALALLPAPRRLSAALLGAAPYAAPSRTATPTRLLGALTMGGPAQDAADGSQVRASHPSLGAPLAQERPSLGDSLVLFPAEFPKVVDLRARQMRRHEAGGTLAWPDGQSGRRGDELRLGPES